MENIMGEDDDKLYEAYQKAHNYYSTLTKFKDESHESILFACNHAKKKDLLNIIGIIVTAISIIFGILGMSNLI